MSEMIKFFKDEKINNGFKVHGARHEEGIVARYPGLNNAVSQPYWTLAQWGVYCNPLNDCTKRVNLENGGFIYETPSIKITSHPQNGEYDLRMELCSTEEYKGHVRNYGEDWCHILLEQGDLCFDTPFLGELDELRYTADVSIDYCDCCMEKDVFSHTVHSCQVHQYLTVQDLKKGHFMWFGIPFYDHRYEVFPGYIGIDSGKEDASGQIIINHSQNAFSNEKVRVGEWVHYDVDLLPLIKKAIEIAWGYNKFLDADLNDIKITSTNIGWEMFYEFNGAVKIKNMQLTGIKR